MSAKTHHCTAVVVNGHGILIKGASGSGKTSLALGLVERAYQKGWQASLVGDDRLHLNEDSGRLMAVVPDVLAGKAELRGYGIVNLPHVSEAAISLVANLVDDDTIERMPDSKTVAIEKVTLPLIEVPVRHEEQAARILMAWLHEQA